MAFTSDQPNAATLDTKIIQMEVNTEIREKPLPFSRGFTYTRSKGDLWKLNMIEFFGFATSCITEDEVKRIEIINEGSDGWVIDSIVTYLVIDNRHYKQSSVDLEVFREIDDDTPEHRTFELHLTL